VSTVPGSPGLSTGKRIFFVVATVLVAAVLVEAAVWAIFRPAVIEVEALAAVEEVADTTNVNPGREKAGLGFRDPSMTLHPYLGYVFLPNKYRAADAQAPPAIAISNDGFLDKNDAVQHRASGQVIVGITGGSVAGQLGTWHAQLMADALAQLDVFAGRDVKFVWLGMPGYHQPQQAIQLIYVLAQGGDFDYVINLDGFNELAVPAALNEPFGANPLYPMNWSMVALDVPDAELRRSMGAVDYLRTDRRARNEAFASSPWRFSPTARLLHQRSDERMAQRMAGYAWQLQSFEPEDVPYFVTGPDRLHLPVEELIPELVTVWTRSSEQMNAICSAYGIRYLHCLQPNQYDIGAKPLSSEEKSSAFEAESPYRSIIEVGYPQLRTAGDELRAEGIAFYDLSRIFEKQRQTLYKDNCCHFNAEGNRIMANAIAQAIAQTN
jgi:hypothetical protein